MKGKIIKQACRTPYLGRLRARFVFRQVLSLLHNSYDSYSACFKICGTFSGVTLEYSASSI